MRGVMSVALQLVLVAFTSIAAMAQSSGVTADLAGTVVDQTVCCPSGGHDHCHCKFNWPDAQCRQ
jgi:type 1 fimbria pilin